MINGEPKVAAPPLLAAWRSGWVTCVPGKGLVTVASGVAARSGLKIGAGRPLTSCLLDPYEVVG
jgi:hypothetical protein